MSHVSVYIYIHIYPHRINLHGIFTYIYLMYYILGKFSHTIDIYIYMDPMGSRGIPRPLPWS